MQQEFYNWTYCYENGQYEIIPDKEIARPDSFYKYYALNEHNVDAIIHTYIYAAHPKQFNDIMDCSHLLLEFDMVDMIRQQLSGVPDFAKLKDAKLLTNDNRILAQMTFTAMIYQHIGVFSLSSKNDDLLMWAYYTNNCGFCVEYDVSKFCLKKHGPFPVNYQDHLKPVLWSEIKDPHIAMLFQSNVKHSIWKPENEWRLLVESPENVTLTSYGILKFEKLGGYNRKFPIPVDSIKRVVLGMSFFDFNERLSSFEDIENTKKCKFRLTDAKDKKNRKPLLDFLCLHHIRVDYTFVLDIDCVQFIPFYLHKFAGSDDCYEGDLIN